MIASITASMLTYFCWGYFEPVLAFRLEELTDSTYLQSLVFFSLPFGYSVMSLFIPYIIDCFSSYVMVSLGLFLCGLSNLLIGPSIFLPDGLVLMIIGMFLTGFTNLIFVVKLIPIMLERVKKVYPNQASQASDICSSMFVACISIGQFISMIYGGYMYDIIGFRFLCDTVCWILVSFTFIFYLMTCRHTEIQRSDLKMSGVQITESNMISFIDEFKKRNAH